MNLFERVVELRVGDTFINGLDISFEIEKDENPEPNPCHVEIFNLSATNRATLSKYKNVPVCLKAGYKDSVDVIFQGDMIRCNHLKEGPTWKTTLASGDGALAIQTKRTHKSFAKGTPIKTIVDDLVKQLGLPSNHAFSNLFELGKLLNRNFSLSGNPMNELTHLLSSCGISTSIQNQTLQIRRSTEGIQKEAISLSSTSGLIAAPEIDSDGKVTVRSVIMSGFLPGRIINVASERFSGLAVIESVRFSGSNFSHAWDAEMVCRS